MNRLLGFLQDAGDVVQETMLRAWLRFDTFKDLALPHRDQRLPRRAQETPKDWN